MMSNKQTNKKKIQSYHLALHSLRERFWGWNGELSSKQLDEHRGWGWEGIGGGRRRSIKFMRGWKFKKVQEDRGWLRSWRCGNAPRTAARSRGEVGGACVGVRGFDVKQQQKKIIIRKWSFLNLSHREKSNGARAREGGIERERERGWGLGRGRKRARWGEWKVPPTLWHTLNGVPQAEEMTELGKQLAWAVGLFFF